MPKRKADCCDLSSAGTHDLSCAAMFHMRLNSNVLRALLERGLEKNAGLRFFSLPFANFTYKLVMRTMQLFKSHVGGEALAERYCTDCLTVESWTKPGLKFRFRVASDRTDRERTYRFAHEIYSGVALAEGAEGMVLSPHDAGPETFTLLAEDMDGQIQGTVSLVFDSERGLPCDEIYWVETGRMREEGRRMAEVTRLALRKDGAMTRDVLVRLFNLIYIYARRVRRFTDFVIEVHPRHLKYYERTLGFEGLGGLQSCARVGGAPAMLGRLDLAVPEREVRCAGGTGSQAAGHSLYPYFWAMGEESAIARHLAQEYRPMPPADAAYFRLDAQAAKR